MLRCFDGIDFIDKEVLEMGHRRGEDPEQVIRRGARWSGLDLTAESIERLRARLALYNLAHEDLKQRGTLDISYPDNSFDMVNSSGVLLHIPEIGRA